MVTVSFGLFFSVLVVAIAVGGLLLVRQRIHHSQFQRHHDVADPLLSVVGTLFAVLLGFMIANAMQRFQDAQTTTQQEANAVMDLYRLAAGVPDGARRQIRSSLSDYVTIVIYEEWPKLAEKKTSELAWQKYNDIWNECVTFHPASEGENNVHAKLLDSLTAFGDNRRMRVEALHTGLPPVLWGVLVAGGIGTIVFTYFFGIENARVQIMMTAIVSLAISLNLFLLASFDDPFSGDVMVRPLPFQVDEKSIKQIAMPGTPYESRSPVEIGLSH